MFICTESTHWLSIHNPAGCFYIDTGFVDDIGLDWV